MLESLALFCISYLSDTRYSRRIIQEFYVKLAFDAWKTRLPLAWDYTIYLFIFFFLIQLPSPLGIA